MKRVRGENKLNHKNKTNKKPNDVQVEVLKNAASFVAHNRLSHHSHRKYTATEQPTPPHTNNPITTVTGVHRKYPATATTYTLPTPTTPSPQSQKFMASLWHSHDHLLHKVQSNRTTYTSLHQQPHHHSHRSSQLPSNTHMTISCRKYTATAYISPHQQCSHTSSQLPSNIHMTILYRKHTATLTTYTLPHRQPHHHCHKSSWIPSNIHMTAPCKKYTATAYTSPHQQWHQCTWQDAGPHHGNRAGTPAADLQGRPAPQPEGSCGGWPLQRPQRPTSCPGDPQSLRTQPHGLKKEIKTHPTTWAGKRDQNTHNHMHWDQNTQPHGCQNAHNHTGWKKKPKPTQKHGLEKEIKTHAGLQINSFQRGTNKFLSKTKGHK